MNMIYDIYDIYDYIEGALKTKILFLLLACFKYQCYQLITIFQFLRAQRKKIQLPAGIGPTGMILHSIEYSSPVNSDLLSKYHSNSLTLAGT